MHKLTVEHVTLATGKNIRFFGHNVPTKISIGLRNLFINPFLGSLIDVYFMSTWSERVNTEEQPLITRTFCLSPPHYTAKQSSSVILSYFVIQMIFWGEGAKHFDWLHVF
jgi:hypothetical protein